jgi:4-diphosphocytidyl-2-C-methyl-D-erythritol kinase
MRASAPAKINLGLVVGPSRDDGKHELLTVYQRVGIADRIDVEPSDRLLVEGFAGDTLVSRALQLLAERAGIEPAWRVRIEKRLPVAAGLGGGSSDAATALRLANETADVDAATLHAVAAEVGADVPFFLREGPQLGSGDGTTLEPVDLPQDFWVLLLLPADARKESTAAVYRAFDERNGAHGWPERAAAFRATIAGVRRPRDLVQLPPNDLAHSPHSARLAELGAFHADVSGAGPAVYGLFHHKAQAERAERALKPLGRTWLTAPAWYG